MAGFLPGGWVLLADSGNYSAQVPGHPPAEYVAPAVLVFAWDCHHVGGNTIDFQKRIRLDSLSR